GRRARQVQLRAAALAVDLRDVRAHAISDAQVLLRDHLVARQARLDLARLDDGALAIHALDRSGEHRFAACEEVVDDLLALGVADLLQEDLLGGLRADAPEVDRLELFLDVVADLDVADLLLRFGQDDLDVVVLEFPIGHDQPAAERLRLAGHAVDRHADVDFLLEALLHGGSKRALERAEHDLALDVLLARERIDQQQNFPAHLRLSWNFSFGTSRARSTSSSEKTSLRTACASRDAESGAGRGRAFFADRPPFVRGGSGARSISSSP